MLRFVPSVRYVGWVTRTGKKLLVPDTTHRAKKKKKKIFALKKDLQSVKAHNARTPTE